MSEYGPDIYVEDVLVHRNYFSSLFHDNPWYFFGEMERVGDLEFFDMSNLKNGKVARYIQDHSGKAKIWHALVSYACETMNDLVKYRGRIESLGGSIFRDVLEVGPGHYILWAKDPSGLHFGLWKLPFDY